MDVMREGRRWRARRWDVFEFNRLRLHASGEEDGLLLWDVVSRLQVCFRDGKDQGDVQEATRTTKAELLR